MWDVKGTVTKVRPETRDSCGVIWSEPSTEIGKKTVSCFDQCYAMYYRFDIFQESFTLITKINEWMLYVILEEGKEKIAQVIMSKKRVPQRQS